MKRGQDHYGRRAKREGLASRAVYKLEEIDRRLRIFRPGLRVLDLGAAPGSWSAYACEHVGPRGRVLAVDQNPIDVALPLQGEARQADVTTLVAEELGGAGSFDVVLSDMAPRTSGQRHADQHRSYELYARALAIATDVLAPGGTFVGKIFQGPAFDDARRETRERFVEVRVLKPNASRRESYEIYLVGLGRR